MALLLSHRTMRFSNLFLLLPIASSTIKAMPPKAKVVAAAAAVADADSDGEGRHDDLGLDGGYASTASDDAPRRDSTHTTGNAALFKHMEVAPPGITHYGRQEGHQELDQRGVLESQISRLANRDGGGGSQVVNDSYLVNLPVDAVVASGGYDQTALRAVVAPHHVHVPAALLYFLSASSETTKS